MAQRYNPPGQWLWCLYLECDVCGHHFELVGDRAAHAVARRQSHKRVICDSCITRTASRAS